MALNFVGRRRPAAHDCRPASTTSARDWPVLTAEVTPQLDPARWTMTVDGLVEQPTTWTWDEMHALPASAYSGDIHCVTTWSKFDTASAASASTSCSTPPARSPRRRHVLATSTTGYTTNLPLDRLTRRPGLGRLDATRAAAAARARRSGPAAGPAPVLLEVRQVGHPADPDRPRPARVLGAQRLPRPRRPLARAALPG